MHAGMSASFLSWKRDLDKLKATAITKALFDACSARAFRSGRSGIDEPYYETVFG
jgi:hypothetical protein